MVKKQTGKSKKKRESSANSPKPISGVPINPDKAFHDLFRILSRQEFGSIEEANQFMQELLTSTGGRVPEAPPLSPVEAAQDVMFQAWESPNRAQRIRLARKALDISPDCADAYVLLAEENAKTAAEARALYEEGVKAGERALGEEFAEMEGDFWGFHETRPYMRARLGLAQVLWGMGEFGQAAEHLREMLRLNPGDNQGVRYLLASLLTEMGEDAGLEKLLQQYPDDWSANWKYASALLAFRKQGKSEEAVKLLKEAIAFNPFVPAFLLGRKRIPKQLPSFVSPGREDEAIHCAVEGIMSWQKTPGALEWLAEVVAQS